MKALLSIATRLVRTALARPVAWMLAKLGRLDLLDRAGLEERGRQAGSLWYVDMEPYEGPTDDFSAGIRCERPGAKRVSIQPYEWKQQLVGELPDVTLVGPDPIAVTSSGELVVDAVVPTLSGGQRIRPALARTLAADWRQLHQVMTSPAPLSVASRGIECGCLLSSGWRNYYHWTLEHVLKLRAVEVYRRETGVTPVLIMPPDPEPWMEELLDLVGWRFADRFDWGGEALRVESLVLPSYPEPSLPACEWLRERVLDSLRTQTAAEGERRLLISRAGAAKRRIVNESEVRDALSSHGFAVGSPDTLTVAGQVKLFAGASVVVSPHGAGLTNMVWSRGLRVIELFGAEIRPHYSRLAQVLGHEYQSVQCRSRGHDLVVDEPSLDAILTLIGGDRRPR